MEGILWPRNTLHVENGRIVPAPAEPRSPDGLTRIYVLVHGFNNDRAQAEANYQAFRKRLADIIDDDQARHIWEFYWPGYEELISEPLRRYWVPRIANTAFTAVCYLRQVPKAVASGAMLADYLLHLRAQRQATEVVLIAHSLGCRVVMEALAAMAPVAPRSKVPAVMLMAGAVSVNDVAGRLKPAVAFPERGIALYSSRDSVLRWVFPEGEAIGLTGNPRECWSARDQTMLTHGEYWADTCTTPNVARLFGKVTRHALPYSEIVPRVLPEPPPLPEWRSPERRL